MDPSRTLVWTIAADVGFDTAKVKAALLKLASEQRVSAYGSGGKVLTSTSVSGESFNFTVPNGFDPTSLSELCRQTYRIIADFTNAELEAYALQDVAGGIQIDFRTLTGV
jgi:hypothetical protein